MLMFGKVQEALNPGILLARFSVFPHLPDHLDAHSIKDGLRANKRSLTHNRRISCPKPNPKFLGFNQILVKL